MFGGEASLFTRRRRCLMAGTQWSTDASWPVTDSSGLLVGASSRSERTVGRQLCVLPEVPVGAVV